ncbi:MAG: hypothetical protein M3040_06300, partial [Bacteroidota bacterium]|nr:hypothetical protein [Bacteroidota bacterium]
MPARSDNFQKFVKQKKGSAIKEEIKQQKRKEKKEKAAAIEAHFERKRAERQQRQQPLPTAASSKTGRPNKYPKKEVELPAGKDTRAPDARQQKTGPSASSRQTAGKGAFAKAGRQDKHPAKENTVTGDKSAGRAKLPITSSPSTGNKSKTKEGATS